MRAELKPEERPTTRGSGFAIAASDAVIGTASGSRTGGAGASF